MREPRQSRVPDVMELTRQADELSSKIAARMNQLEQVQVRLQVTGLRVGGLRNRFEKFIAVAETRRGPRKH